MLDPLDLQLIPPPGHRQISGGDVVLALVILLLLIGCVVLAINGTGWPLGVFLYLLWVLRGIF